MKRNVIIVLVIVLALILFIVANNFYSKDVRLSSEQVKFDSNEVVVEEIGTTTGETNVGDGSKVLEGESADEGTTTDGENDWSDDPKQEPEIIFASNECVSGFEQCGTLCCEVGTCGSLGGSPICKPKSSEDCTAPNTKLCLARDLNMCCHPTDKCGVQIIGPIVARKYIATCLPGEVDACKSGETPCGDYIDIENVEGKLCCQEGSSCKKIDAPGKDIYFCEFSDTSCTIKGLEVCRGVGSDWGEVKRCCNAGECHVSNGGMPHCAPPQDNMKQA